LRPESVGICISPRHHSTQHLPCLAPLTQIVANITVPPCCLCYTAAQYRNSRRELSRATATFSNPHWNQTRIQRSRPSLRCFRKRDAHVPLLPDHLRTNRAGIPRRFHLGLCRRSGLWQKAALKNSSAILLWHHENGAGHFRAHGSKVPSRKMGIESVGSCRSHSNVCSGFGLDGSAPDVAGLGGVARSTGV